MQVDLAATDVDWCLVRLREAELGREAGLLRPRLGCKEGGDRVWPVVYPGQPNSFLLCLYKVWSTCFSLQLWSPQSLSSHQLESLHKGVLIVFLKVHWLYSIPSRHSFILFLKPWLAQQQSHEVG